MATADFVQIVQQAIDAQFHGGEWLATSVLALSVSASLAALAWMISEFLKSSDLKGWAKEEMAQLIYSAVLIALLFPLLILLHSMSISLFGYNYYDYGAKYLKELALDLESSTAYLISLKQLFEGLGSIKFPLSLITAGITAISTALFGPGAIAPAAATVLAVVSNSQIDYFGPLKSSVGPVDVVLKAVIPALFATLVQIQLLEFMQKTMLTFVLPMGLVLRAFSLTRRAGSTLIALALVGAIIYPLSVCFIGPIYDTVAPEFDQGNMTVKQPSQGAISQELPSVNTYYMNKSTDKFQWSISANNYTYRVWFLLQSGTGKCPTTLNVWSSDEVGGNFTQPPLGGGYGVWEQHRNIESLSPDGGISYVDTYRCFQVADTGFGTAGKNIVFNLNHPTLVGVEDKETEILIDAYSHTSGKPDTPLNYLSTKVFLGDPCKDDIFNWFSCYFGRKVATSPSASLTVGSQSLAVMKGGLAAISDTFGSLKDSVLRGKGWVLWTPSLAAFAYLEMTDRLPSMVFPILLTTITIIFTLIMSLSSFRSISAALGGEGEITELSRLI
ncbi:Uncharacterised protein [uncultured archaeon]|nr:Uncharacterised protein [uncultured archaeon]